MQRRGYLHAAVALATGTALAGCTTDDSLEENDPLEANAGDLLLSEATLGDDWSRTFADEESGPGATIEIEPEAGLEPIVTIEETVSRERATATFEHDDGVQQLISTVLVYDSIEDARDEWDDSVQALAASFESSELEVGTEAYGLNSLEPFVLLRDADAIGFVRHFDPDASEESAESEGGDGDEEGEPADEDGSTDEQESTDGEASDYVATLDTAIEFAELKHDIWR
ncbi:hypothetical protein OB919_16485 [Halobacteria archaeon AArc-curdl1]|uniref:Uncharacterized protein n=1 Tax=Natronosalvus hydrolyticus TaxID=2979988 RepID=A0AAP2ZAH4_9EURY|nr:hypothetical protein [Halobacteria archaeon AArc-curdl1]